MNVPQHLAAYDELQPGYGDVARLKGEAEEFPDLYTQADELEADLNESAHDLLDGLVATLRGRDRAELERQMMTAVENLIGPGVYVESYVRDRAREFVERAAWWADGGDPEKKEVNEMFGRNRGTTETTIEQDAETLDELVEKYRDEAQRQGVSIYNVTIGEALEFLNSQR